MSVTNGLAEWRWQGGREQGGKFAPPPLPRFRLHRDRLERLVSMGVADGLTVVTGPPGAGKTVLVGDWAQAQPHGSVAWLSVEEADNDPGCFWPQVSAAFGLFPAGDVGSAGMTPPDSDGWADLLVRSAATTPYRALIVDDIHLITDGRILKSLGWLVEHAPSQLRLVLVGRHAPAPVTPRLRLGGTTTMLANSDLRFTVEEVAALIALASGKLISVEGLTALTERSGGWAAGLYAAARALADEEDPERFVRGFSGAFDPVAGYMEHEVLLQQPPDLIRFLLQTSVVDRLQADLCRAVTGRADARDVLASLAERNLFVLSVEANQESYRYQRLFADVLRSRMQREDWSMRRHAHFNAAIWFERHGDLAAAANHFAQAHAYDRAFALVFSNLGRALPDDGCGHYAPLAPAGAEADGDNDPGALYLLAAASLGASDTADAANLLGQLAALTGHDPHRARWEGRVEFLWARHAERLADASGALQHARLAAELLTPSDNARPGPSATLQPERAWLARMDKAICSDLPVLTARAAVWLGEPDEGRRILEEHFAGPEHAEAAQPAILALAAAQDGRLTDAYRLASVILQPENAGARVNDLDCLDAQLAIAHALFEHDELDDAEQHLDAALELCQARGASHWVWPVRVEMIRVAMARQHVGEGLNLLGHLRQLEARNPPPYHIRRQLNQVEIDFRTSLGDLEGALLIARSVPAEDLSMDSLARIELCSGRPDRAQARLRSITKPASVGEIRGLVVLACAQMQQGDAGLAMSSLRRAVDAARAERYVRPFMEATPRTRPLLAGLAATSRVDPYLTQLVHHAEQNVPATRPPSGPPMLEPLTERERQILGYLPSYLNQHQIAEDLHLGLNTIKTYMKSIYRKTGATTRSEAVAVARSYGLI
jgi:LuxR family maltose regulon positive regulatory protein